MKIYRFYDEREVRMVPDIDELKSDGRSKILSTKEYDDYKKNNGSSLLDFGVSFDWNDVEYIVVKDKAQVVRTKGMLLGDGCDNDNINVLHSSQIKEDIIGIDHNEIIEKPNQASLELSDKQSRVMRAIISGSTSPDYWDIMLESMRNK